MPPPSLSRLAPAVLTRRQFAGAALASAAYVAAPTCLRCQTAVARDLRFETDSLMLELTGDGWVRSVRSRHDNTEYAIAGPVATICQGGSLEPGGTGEHAAVIGHWVYRGGTRTAATRVERQGDQLVIDFGPAKVKAVCKVVAAAGYLAFELQSVEGPPVDRIEFFQLTLRRPPFLGEWVNLAYDEKFGVCLCGGTRQTDVQMAKAERQVRMTAAAEAAVGFRGATAVLFGCRDPRASFLGAMAAIERDFHLPAGAAARRLPQQRYSYLWADRPDPKNIGQYIQWAKLGGFRTVLFSYRAFARGAGHYAWNDRYPEGIADLKRVTDALRAAGLKVGLHLHYSKVDRTDAYVTPVPDERLHAERNFTLAAAVDAGATTIPVREDPAGCTLDRERRLLRVGRELIEYEAFQSGGGQGFAFTGCRRGHLKTTAAAHPAGERCALIDVDTWTLFIRIDQNSTLQDEMAARIADVYRQTGPYDLVYFDGAEDVHAPFWYHAATAQERVYRLLQPPPAVCEAAHYTHFGWHMISRSNAYDIVAPPEGQKDFCRLMPCRTAGTRALDFSRLDFGWLGGFGSGRAGGPDVYEYVASRAAAWDCPLSLRMSNLAANPRAEDCLAAIKIWEDARLGNHLRPEQLKQLRNVTPEDAAYVSCYEQRRTYEMISTPEKLSDAQRRILADRREHHLFLNEAGRHELVEIFEVPAVADGRAKAFVFARADHPRTAYALVWAVKGELRLEMPRGAFTAMRPFGAELPVAAAGEVAAVNIGNRTYLALQNKSLEEARKLLRQARMS